MKRICFSAMTLALLCGVNSLAFASPFYESNLIAKAGAAADVFDGRRLVAFKESPSINRHGTVAFIGRFSSGEGVFRRKLSQLYPDFLSPGDVAPNKEFGSVAVNSLDQVATPAIITGNPTIDRLRLYEPSGTSFEVLLGAGPVRDPWGNAIFEFDSLFAPIALNDHGRVAYVGQPAFTTITALKVTKLPGRVNFTGFAGLHPRILADERVLLKSGTRNDSPILLWNLATTSSVPIATGAGGFISTGRRPDIAPDGSVAVFTGDRGAGVGIFASLASSPGTARRVVRLLGEYGGTNGIRPDLGTNRLGQPFYFSAFEPDAPVGIAHYPPRATRRRR